MVTPKNKTKYIAIKGGVRQVDSLSSLLFYLIINQIISETKKQQGYRMGNHKITIICYTDDAILIARQ
ncbi:hypothetical protein M0802_009707 [Mischocyttarus mexicanus]|nr:hypothetical protein M0802_009707 [Mischocyttarus mexicanus]